MLNKLLYKLNVLRAQRCHVHSPYSVELQDIPDGLFRAWQQSAPGEFEGIPCDALFFARATEGLLMFFDCVKRSGKPCALPSKAADSVWHAWARLSPASLDAFCIKHFGRRMPHMEAADMTAQMEDALANCLVQARMLEWMPTAGAGLPKLFTLDRRVAMPCGFAYRMVKGQVAFSNMNRAGRPEGDVFYPGMLAPVELLMAGLITQRAFDDYVRQARSEGSACAVFATRGGALH
jgi:hypothetical protein